MPFNIYPAVDENNKFPPVIRQAMVLYSEMIAAFSGKYLEQDVANHKANVANPHVVTKAQVGLGSADNTSDITKPISTATQNALNLKAPLASPTFTGTVTTNGDFEVSDSTKGFVIKAPNGTRYRLTVGDDGALTTTAL